MTKTCFQIYKQSSPILRRSGSLRSVPKFPKGAPNNVNKLLEDNEVKKAIKKVKNI